MSELRIIGLGGSLAEHSTSLAALRIALNGSREGGAATALFDIRELDLPMYDPTKSAVPAGVIELCEAVYAADGMIWSSPMYHGTISGSFKNALDWMQLLSKKQPPYLTDKVIGLISTAGGTQGLQAVNTMEFVVRSLRGWAVPLVLPIAQAWKIFNEDGSLSDPQVEHHLKALGREVARAARQFAIHPPTDEAAIEAENAQRA
ncbi:MAG TPA: NADPH-dependent FMN reductase [Thermoanaerobaculia bacterium]|nr:NADPH-dependent FMN reductase [Thermoanaerobaculia bacterium]